MISTFQCCGSGIFIPDPNCYQAFENVIRVFRPGSGFFLPIPDPGSRGQKDAGSRIRIRKQWYIPSDECQKNNKKLNFNLTGLVEHIVEEHGEELRRLCLVCAEAVEDSERGTASNSPSFLLYLLLRLPILRCVQLRYTTFSYCDVYFVGSYIM
jgi:hypothetical protein